MPFHIWGNGGNAIPFLVFPNSSYSRDLPIRYISGGGNSSLLRLGGWWKHRSPCLVNNIPRSSFYCYILLVVLTHSILCPISINRLVGFFVINTCVARHYHFHCVIMKQLLLSYVQEGGKTILFLKGCNDFIFLLSSYNNYPHLFLGCL